MHIIADDTNRDKTVMIREMVDASRPRSIPTGLASPLSSPSMPQSLDGGAGNYAVRIFETRIEKAISKNDETLFVFL